VLPPEQKHKAKNVIDTLAHRFGDTSSTWIFAGRKGAEMLLAATTWLAVPVAGAWLAVASWLGRQHRERTATPNAGSAATFSAAKSRV
jgi:AAA family ATP:ADP antiporter